MEEARCCRQERKEWQGMYSTVEPHSYELLEFKMIDTWGGGGNYAYGLTGDMDC